MEELKELARKAFRSEIKFYRAWFRLKRSVQIINETIYWGPGNEAGYDNDRS